MKNNVKCVNGVIMAINEREKVINAFLGCKIHEAEEKMISLVNSIGWFYRGYQIVSEEFPLNDNEVFVVNVKIHN